MRLWMFEAFGKFEPLVGIETLRGFESLEVSRRFSFEWLAEL